MPLLSAFCAHTGLLLRNMSNTSCPARRHRHGLEAQWRASFLALGTQQRGLMVIQGRRFHPGC